jgi:hypothetical protein
MIDIVAMLPAVGFDDKSAFNTGEVRNASSNGHLLPELEPTQLTIAKAGPEPPLGFGCLAP